MPRILICDTCRTIEDLPLDQMPVEQRQKSMEPEPLLLKLMERHNHGPVAIAAADAPIKLVEVPDAVWDNPMTRDDILSELRQTWSGFEPEFYATKQTFVEDAGKCFNQHHRPKEGCIDYHVQGKLLTPAAWKDEDVVEATEALSAKLKEAIGDLNDGRKPVFLCDFCPVSSYVTTKVRDARGMYK